VWSGVASVLAPGRRHRWAGYAAAIVGVALTTPLVGLLDRWIGLHPASPYLVVVLITGGLYGVGPSLLAVALAGLVYRFLFLVPQYSLEVPNPRALIELLLNLLTAFIGGQLAAALRRGAEAGALRELEERVEARTRELRALYGADELLHRSLRLDDVLQALVEAAVELPGAGTAAVSLLDPQQERLRVRAAQGISRELDRRLSELPARSILYQVVKSGEPMVVDDVLSDPRLGSEIRAINEEFGVRSIFAHPIVLDAEVIGVFTARSTRPGAIGATEQRLLTALAQRAGLAIQNARLYEQAEQLAVLDERQRLSRELHDSVSQALYGIALNASAAEAVRERAPERLAELHREVLALAEAGLAEMRALIFELRPESLEREGLVAALEKQAAAVQARHGIAVCAALGEEPELPLASKEVLYRIAQEALQNALKHARPSRIELTLREDAGELVLCVADDGGGFDPSGDYPGHLGLHSMRERATTVGGALEVKSTPGAGTQVLARVPAAASF
jgi:signal transduction histidine kinase